MNEEQTQQQVQLVTIDGEIYSLEGYERATTQSRVDAVSLIESVFELIELTTDYTDKRAQQTRQDIIELCTQFENDINELSLHDISERQTDIAQKMREYADILREIGKQQEREGLPRQDTYKATDWIQSVSKASNPKYWQGIENLGNKALKVSSKNEPIRNMYVSIEDNPERETYLQGTAENTHNAVISLIEAGNRLITPNQIAKVAFLTERPTSKQLQIINDDMQRFERVINIDYSEEVRGRNITLNGSLVRNYKIRRQIIPQTKTMITTANGEVVEGYEILALPPLYEHDLVLGLSRNIPIELLETSGKKVSSTETNIIISRYLLRRIERMKDAQDIKSSRSKKKPKDGTKATLNKVRYSSIMNAANLTTDEKGKNKAAARKATREYLDKWKKTGYIKAYKEYTAAGERGISGVEVSI